MRDGSRARRVAVALGVMTAVVALGTPAARAADWSRPSDLSGALASDANPSVGIDDAGRSVTAWERLANGAIRIEMRARQADGTLGPVVVVANTAPTSRPTVAMNGAGVAAIAYEYFDGAVQRLRLRVRSAGGALSAAQTISEAGANVTDYELGIDDSGRVLLAWRTGNGISARVREANGALGAVAVISSSDAADDPQVAMNGAGRGVVVWQENFTIRDRTRPPGGPFSIARTDSTQSAGSPDVGIDASGRYVATWRRAKQDGTSAIEARARAANGTLGAVRTLRSAPGPEPVSDPRIAVNANGLASAVWLKLVAGQTYSVVEGAVLPASAAPTPYRTLSRDGQPGLDPRIAVDDAGRSVAAWAVDAGINSHILSRPLSATGVAGTRTTLSELSASMRDPAVALNGAGAGTAAWHGNNETVDAVQGVFRTGP